MKAALRMRQSYICRKTVGKDHEHILYAFVSVVRKDLNTPIGAVDTFIWIMGQYRRFKSSVLDLWVLQRIVERIMKMCAFFFS